MYRRELGDRDKAYTLVKVDGAQHFRLPPGWKGRLREAPQRVRLYDQTIARIQTVIRERLVAQGSNPDLIEAQIVAPPRRGGAVPHGDVIALLDAFLQAGLTDVAFEGAATPLNSRERAQRRGR